MELLGKPIAEASALCIPTALYAFAGGGGAAWRALTGTDSNPMCGLGWKSLGVLELTALPSLKEEYWVPDVRNADALLVAGGVCPYLGHWMRQSGLAALAPSLRREMVYLGVSAGSMVVGRGVISPEPGESIPPTGYDEGLGLVDFAVLPHLDHPRFAENSMAELETLAARMPAPTYLIDDQTALKVVEGVTEVVSEGNWKLCHP